MTETSMFLLLNAQRCLQLQSLCSGQSDQRYHVSSVNNSFTVPEIPIYSVVRSSEVAVVLGIQSHQSPECYVSPSGSSLPHSRGGVFQFNELSRSNVIHYFYTEATTTIKCPLSAALSKRSGETRAKCSWAKSHGGKM